MSVFASMCNTKSSCSPGIPPPELEDMDRQQNGAPYSGGKMISNLLHYIGTWWSLGPEGIHLRILRNMTKLPTKPLSIICQQSWLTREVPVGWKSANVMLISKKDQKEDLGNYNPVSLTLVPRKVVEQISWGPSCGMFRTNGIRPSQHEFMEGGCCLTNLMPFCDKVICLVEEGKAEDVFYLGFGKAFDPIPHNIILEKLAVHGLLG